MKYSKATSYALHSIVHLALTPDAGAVQVESLAQRQNLSPTYLSKILTKLVKAGLISSTPGVNGGYRLLKEPEQISFLEVIQSIEGYEPLLVCTMGHHDQDHNHECLIENTIADAEHKMQEVLSQKTIASILLQAHARH